MNSNAKQRHALQSIAANLWSWGFVEGLWSLTERQGYAAQGAAKHRIAAQSNADSVLETGRCSRGFGFSMQGIAEQCSAGHGSATQRKATRAASWKQGAVRGALVSQRIAPQCMAWQRKARQRKAPQSNAGSVLETGRCSRGFGLSVQCSARQRIAWQRIAAQGKATRQPHSLGSVVVELANSGPWGKVPQGLHKAIGVF